MLARPDGREIDIRIRRPDQPDETHVQASPSGLGMNPPNPQGTAFRDPNQLLLNREQIVAEETTRDPQVTADP